MNSVRNISCSKSKYPATLFAWGCVLTMISEGCEQRQESDTKISEAEDPGETYSPMADLSNRVLLDEANAAGTWFHARKTRPIWAKRLESAQTVKTLEGDEQVAAGHFLCHGEAGDIWPQTEKDLNRRYQTTDEVDANGWQKYQPYADAEGFMATQIDHPFSVKASWGKLTGKTGDYLLKNFRDRDTAYPDDVWIVDLTLFRQTYEATGMEN